MFQVISDGAVEQFGDANSLPTVQSLLERSCFDSQLSFYSVSITRKSPVVSTFNIRIGVTVG